MDKYLRYELNEITKSVLKEKKLTGVLAHIRGDVPVKTGLFLAKDMGSRNFKTAYEAMDYLALTYAPQWVYELQEEVSVPIYTPSKEFSRVWPTFGCRGGGWEKIMVKGELQVDNEITPKGFGSHAQSSMYWQNSSQMVSLMDFITLGLYFWIKVGTYRWRFGDDRFMVDDRYVEYMPQLKIIPEMGGIIGYLFERKDQKAPLFPCPKRQSSLHDLTAPINAAISCAQLGTTSNLKFWGYLWADCVIDNKRYLSIPQIETYSLKSDINELHTNLLKDSNRLEQLVKILITLERATIDELTALYPSGRRQTRIADIIIAHLAKELHRTIKDPYIIQDILAIAGILERIETSLFDMAFIQKMKDCFAQDFGIPL